MILGLQMASKVLTLFVMYSYKTIIWDFIAPCPGFLPESIYKSRNRDFPEGTAGKSNYNKPVSQKLSEIWFSDHSFQESQKILWRCQKFKFFNFMHELIYSISRTQP